MIEIIRSQIDSFLNSSNLDITSHRYIPPNDLNFRWNYEEIYEIINIIFIIIIILIILIVGLYKNEFLTFLEAFGLFAPEFSVLQKI